MSARAGVEMRWAATVFKALGHPERLRIVARLAEGLPLTQHERLAELPWAQSTLARHVAVLRQRGLIEAQRHGNEVHLRLADDLVPRLLETIMTYRTATGAGGTAAALTAAGGASA